MADGGALARRTIMRRMAILVLGLAVLGLVSPALAAGKGKGRPIDKSCIMMCDKWGEHDCLKWVMRCKGDPGYPKGLILRP
jgi:hypothetical protein